MSYIVHKIFCEKLLLKTLKLKKDPGKNPETSINFRIMKSAFHTKPSFSLKKKI